MNSEQLKYLNLTMPAEWEDQEAVLMAFPHEDTDWGAYLDDARRQFARIIAELTWRQGDPAGEKRLPDQTIYQRLVPQGIGRRPRAGSA